MKIKKPMSGIKLFYDVVRLCWGNKPSLKSPCHTASHVASDHLIAKDMSHEHRETAPEGRHIFGNNSEVHHSDRTGDKILNVCILLF